MTANGPAHDDMAAFADRELADGLQRLADSLPEWSDEQLADLGVIVRGAPKPPCGSPERVALDGARVDGEAR